MKKNIFLIISSFIFIGLLYSATKMQQAPVTNYSAPGYYAYEYTISLSTPSTSGWIQVPGGIKSTSMTLTLTGGASAYVQTTTDNVYKIETASATVNGLTWNYGTVSTTKQDTAYSISAFRLIQISTGTATLATRAQ